MTLTPNTPITQENAALLKAGDWLHDGFYDPWQFDRIENDVAYGQDGYTAMILERLYRNRFIRPALAKPAEDHIGDATEKVDWERVGPKLVEALEAIKAGGSWQGDTASDALAPTQPQSNGE